MKLITKAIEKELLKHPLYSTDGQENKKVIVKFFNPCGVGTAENIYEAYLKAYNSDPTSIFGGILVANREIDEKTATEINKIFMEIVVAPSYSEKALEILKTKKNIRILKLNNIMDKQDENSYDFKKVSGGLLVQTIDSKLLPEEAEIKTVTKTQPSENEMKDLIMAWKIVKHTKSNAIVLVKNGQSIGIGPGQVNRIWACSDCVEAAAAAGITAIIQPGGSIKDNDSINACNNHNISMLFTGMRHFKH